MSKYFVAWFIGEDAETPLEAAKLAFEHMRDPESIATVFEVLDVKTGESFNIDLGEDPATDKPDIEPHSPAYSRDLAALPGRK